jgi:2-succinyl-5-enolpyruvyl-6-hydroxy-3-cyclohexene-1-carboxylate synthase
MNYKNFSHYLLNSVVEKLVDMGIDHFFIAPGSRSTPIVSAIVRKKSVVNIHLGIDERSLGYLALGYSKRTQKTCVVVVTSGTAVANLYPAVVEAFLSEIPMLIFTADRPYELRDSGANQTIFQANIFSNHINKSFDLAPPSSKISLNRYMAIFETAFLYTNVPKKGPVHINLQLREPLQNSPEPPYWADKDHFFMPKFVSSIYEKSPEKIYGQKKLIKFITDILSFRNGIIVVGELLPSLAQERILELSSHLNWPIFADITSNLRLEKHHNIVHHYDIALINNSFVQKLDVDVVIKFGGRLVSKRFWQWAQNNQRARFISLGESSIRIDHIGRFTHIHVEKLIDTLINFLKQVKTKSFAKGVIFINEEIKKINKAIDIFLDNQCNNEAFFAARLIAQINKPVNLFISSSMPIRDLDQFAKPTTTSIHIYANRGASGIDGIISSAAGVAIMSSRPTILFIGDIAFLHDSNALMLLKNHEPLLIVLMNNKGGGIFHLLPVAKDIDIVTPYCDTPHDVDLNLLCQAHGIKHEKIVDPVDFDKAIERFFFDSQTKVIEVVVERKKNVHLHKTFYQQISQMRL